MAAGVAALLVVAPLSIAGAVPIRWYLQPVEAGDPDEPGRSGMQRENPYPDRITLLTPISVAGATFTISLRMPRSLASRLGVR
jgi:hypothetical protein